MRAKLLGAAALLGAIVTNAPSYVQETAAQETTITAYQGGEELTRTCRVFMQWRRTGRERLKKPSTQHRVMRL